MKIIFYSYWLILGTFEDKEITHVEGEVDPIRDLDIINEELRLKDEEQFMKYFEDLEKKYQRGEKKLKQEYVSDKSNKIWVHKISRTFWPKKYGKFQINR